MKKISGRIFTIIIALIVIIAGAGIGYLVYEDTPTNSETPVKNGQMLFSDLKRENNPKVPDNILSELTGGNTKFAIDMYHKICEEDGNLFYSPYSISLALAMTYAGANGETANQMADTLHFDLSQEKLHKAFNALDQKLTDSEAQENFTINIANAFWGQENYHFEENFLDRIALNYGAGIRLLDFAEKPEPSRLTINEWVENQTENKIKDLLPPGSIGHLTRAVITNAIYFNAIWQHPFSESNTQENTFTLLDGSEVTVPMMSQTESFKYTHGGGYEAIKLPYQGENMSMLIFMPTEGQFGDFENSLSSGTLENIIREMESEKIALRMPKFEFKASLKLANVLSDMGMPAAFDETVANFSGITGDRSLFIDQVLHKAFVSVDENGTEAAAATAVVMPTSAPVSPVELSLDHPFIFMIRDDETESILFLGRMLDPTA